MDKVNMNKVNMDKVDMDLDVADALNKVLHILLHSSLLAFLCQQCSLHRYIYQFRKVKVKMQINPARKNENIGRPPAFLSIKQNKNMEK